MDFYLCQQVILVTSGAAGIGNETTQALHFKNATGYIGIRSPLKAVGALAKLKEESGKEPCVRELDLADSNSLKRAAQEFLKKEEFWMC